MIKDLEISNFLAFSHLKVANLKRINLITGRNNAGKTAFLEAIRTYKSYFNPNVINEILENRGYDVVDDESYLGLYNKISRDKEDQVLSINGIYLKTQIDAKYVQFPKVMDSKDSVLSQLHGSQLTKGSDKNLKYIPFGVDTSILEKQWKFIDLTPEEDDVVSILKSTIQENIVRLSITSKQILIRLDGEEKPRNIKVLGDGIKRILMIAMAMASSKNKIVLIDEIETGLHHSVLTKLWEIVFKYAQKWNIQVFATTHSNDAIRTFRNYASTNENHRDMTNIIRLQKSRKTKEIEAIAYEYEEMDIILDAKDSEAAVHS